LGAEGEGQDEGIFQTASFLYPLSPALSLRERENLI
jgi:hypothetical protein